MIVYEVISPDGFNIYWNTYYRSKEKALQGFEEWKKRYKLQGYYSSNKERIPLDKLKQHCRVLYGEMEDADIKSVILI